MHDCAEVSVFASWKMHAYIFQRMNAPRGECNDVAAGFVHLHTLKYAP